MARAVLTWHTALETLTFDLDDRVAEFVALAKELPRRSESLVRIDIGPNPKMSGTQIESGRQRPEVQVVNFDDTGYLCEGRTN